MSRTQITPAGARGALSPPVSQRGRFARIDDAVIAVPVVTVVSLYLLSTSRWGSYVSMPGAVIYIGDIALGCGATQVGYALVRRRTSLRALTQAPSSLLLALTLMVYAVARFAAQGDISLIALRDLAPYGYALAAVISFLLPPGTRRGWRVAAYGALVFHLIWVVLIPRVSGYPWTLPVLGTDAQVFSNRPDFDAAVLGISAGLAVHQALTRFRTLALPKLAGLGLLAAGSLAGLLGLSTRAGLLSGMLVVATAVVTGMRFHWPGKAWKRHRAGAVAGAVALMVAAGAAVALSPAGSRLADSFSGGAASGTISARQVVWEQIGEYVLSEPERTGVGIGFGRDFIVESGIAAALEGDTYQNVRSPHNYVVGTAARLGIAGGLLTILIMVTAGWAAVRELRREPDTLTALAAFVVIGIPVVALLGVILESPFGAIPYFWAIGHLAASHGRRSKGASGAVAPVATE